MKIVRTNASNATPLEPLSDCRAISLLIARSKIFLSEAKDRRAARHYSGLIDALEKLSKVSKLTQPLSMQNENTDNSPFCEGIPRWILQIEEQFGQYVNPSSTYQQEWTRRRSQLWSRFESSVPARVREPLLSWRWKAEQTAFKSIKVELDEAKVRVDKIEKKLDTEQKKVSEGQGLPGFFDRLLILKWSKEAKKNEQLILLLEAEKQKKLEELSQVLGECEILAAKIAIEMKTTFVDCGDYCSVVFEEFTRTIDTEIKAQLNQTVEQLSNENELLRQRIDLKQKNHQSEFEKSKSVSERLNRVLNDEWDKKVEQAKELVHREFLVLNSFELESQDDAVERWRTAVSKMNNLLKTAEESLCHGRVID